jgi:hypothetical protein
VRLGGSKKFSSRSVAESDERIGFAVVLPFRPTDLNPTPICDGAIRAVPARPEAVSQARPGPI